MPTTTRTRVDLAALPSVAEVVDELEREGDRLCAAALALADHGDLAGADILASDAYEVYRWADFARTGGAP